MTRGRVGAGVAALLALASLWHSGGPGRRPPPPHQAIALALDSLAVRALMAGAGDTTLLLLHGFGESLLTWRAVVDPLARHYRVVALDLPGFGASDKPAGPYSLTRMTAWMTQVVDRAIPRGPVVVIGHSMGGEIAAALAIRRPDRVVAAILIAPAGFALGLGGLIDSMSDRKARTLGWYQSARAFLLPMHDPDWMREPPSMARYDATLDPEYRASTASVLQDFDFLALRTAEPITQPTLLVWGELDPVIPIATSEAIRSWARCATLITLPGALHRPHVERPHQFLDAVMPFLRTGECHRSSVPH